MDTSKTIMPLDELGRLEIPSELRQALNIESGTHIEIFIDGENIILKKCDSSCAVCDSDKDLTKQQA